MKKITIHDIARYAGVSTTTVSMILNGRENFPESTCQRVIDACNQLGYRKASRLTPEDQRSRTITAVIPTLANHYFVEAAEGMLRKAAEKNYCVSVFETNRKRVLEAHIIQNCIESPCDGVAFFYPPENDVLLSTLIKTKPVAFIYEKSGYSTDNILEYDSVAICRTVAHYLLSLGHRKIAFLSLDRSQKQSLREKRLAGLRSVYEEAGYDPVSSVLFAAPETILPDISPAPDSYDLGYLITERLLKQGTDVTAFVGLNDMIAIGAMDAIIDAGKRIPEDFSVSGFDNTKLSSYRGISLTTVDFYSEESGEEAAELLIRKIEQNKSESRTDSDPEKRFRIEYVPKLIIRHSTGPARSN